jgi:SAM-dependent methyltransferase
MSSLLANSHRRRRRLSPDSPTPESTYEIAPGFGVLYDAVPAYANRNDVPFYLEEAASAGSPDAPATVLELGCGTGRVLLPLARAGHTVTGIDRSHSMLARCEAKLAAEPQVVRDRVALHHADARQFTVAAPAGDGFALAIAPFRVLQHLTTTADQLRCLGAVRRHLVPGGRFVFDVFNPHYSLMTRDRSAEVEDTPELRLADGRYLRRTVRITRVRWVEQISEIELIYHVRSESAVERVVHAFPMRWYTASELEHLLGRAGFRIESVYGTFDRGSLTDESPEIIVVAIEKEGGRNEE